MDNKEIKKIIEKLLKNGMSLNEIQDVLASEHNCNMTFLDLRLIASEIESVDWTSGEEEEEPEEQKEDKKEENASQDGTVVEVDKIARPGVALSGSVKFASGATADWVLDQYGRLEFEKADGKPTEQDLQEFQMELRKQLGGV